MKKNFNLFAIALACFAMLFTVACSSDDDDGGKGSGGSPVCSPTEIVPSMVAPAGFADVDNSSGCGAGEELEVSDTNDCAGGEGIPTDGDTADVHGKTVVYNGTHWVYTVEATCAGLVGATIIADNVQLKFNAGTTVVADTAQLSYLSIRPEAQINAVGTETSPVVFTSGAKVGERSSSDWGGIVIHGQAPCNTSSGVNTASDTEIATGSYGGDDYNDDSGVMQYVRIEFAGYEIAAGKEFNGLFLAGVGDETVIDHVQVHRGSDDGIEIFGGSVSISYALLTYNDDDGFDLDDGWMGHANNLVIAKGSDIGDSCIEYDGLGKDDTRITQSFFSNFTFLGMGTGKKKTLINIKKEGALVIVNSIFANFDDQFLTHQGEDDAATPSGAYFVSTGVPAGITEGDGNGYVSAINNSRFESCAIAGTAQTTITPLLSDAEDETGSGNSEYDETDGNVLTATLESFTAPSEYWGENGAADFVPAASPATADPASYTSTITDWGGNDMTPGDYMGAIDPAGTNWLTGWTEFPVN